MRLSQELLEVFGDRGAWRIKETPEYKAEIKSVQRIKDCAKRREAKNALRAVRPSYRVVPCSRGRAAFGKAHIYPHGPDTFAYTGKGMKLFRKLLEVPGVLRHQTGQEEFSVTFPPAAFHTVAVLVKANKKRGRGASRARSADPR